MSLRERLNLPKVLASRLWLITLPSAVISFERRQQVAPLPIGRGRFAGLALVAAGVAAIAASSRVRRAPQLQLPKRGVARFQQKPVVGGGLLALAGAAVLLRSTALTAYTLALALAFALEAIELEEPELPGRAAAEDSAWDYTETLV